MALWRPNFPGRFWNSLLNPFSLKNTQRWNSWNFKHRMLWPFSRQISTNFQFQKTVHLLMASLNHLKIYLFANPDEDSANQWKFELRVDLSADFLKSWRIRWRSQYVKCRLNMAWTSQTNKTILKKTWAWTSQANKIILFFQSYFGINWSINNG